MPRGLHNLGDLAAGVAVTTIDSERTTAIVDHRVVDSILWAPHPSIDVLRLRGCGSAVR
ncbi:hypothetical protein [Rhodococcus sp. C3V]|uniref:hypothetical protein n=1 Tax=Rhodococcus sp. C3V TaxID=3034165 RepID=UPI0023E26916|nr:hypothetical protein [Rhodococcus sp. C3V]MDF3319989.1 hypothetical protein [Rhodococcus sp. C3V]